MRYVSKNIQKYRKTVFFWEDGSISDKKCTFNQVFIESGETMNRILGLFSVGILTLGMLLGITLTPVSCQAAEDSDAAVAAAEKGSAKKATKKKKKSSSKAKAKAQADESESEDGGEKNAAAKTSKSKKSKKSAKAKADDAPEADGAAVEEKAAAEAAKETDASKEADASEENTDGPIDASPISEEGKEAGEVRKITVHGIEYAFCWCPAGTFEMGAPEDELGYSEVEKLHSVKLSKGFWLLQTEVTQEMYESVLNENPSYFSAKGFGKDKGSVKGREETAKFPVDRVSYSDAVRFCEKFSKQVGVEFNLPTEAQWEYACRAGTSYPFYTDKAPTPQQANFKKGENVPESTDEVGKHGKNPWNLCDMMGNVSEWCRDYYAPDYYEKSPAADPVGPDSAENGERVLRGGSFSNLEYYLRSASRNFLIEGAKGNRFDGFRFATVPGGEAAPGASDSGDEEKKDASETSDSGDDEKEDADEE